MPIQSTCCKADRIRNTGSSNYTVNNAGNLTARGPDSFSYDQANRLTSATTTTGSGTYVYDGDGKRVSKTVSGTTTSYVYDTAGGLPVLLDDGTRKYVWGADGLAYSVDKSSAAVQGYHIDGLGSVRALTDGSGNVVQTYQTDEFGVPTQTHGASLQPYGFTGEQRDPESDLSYLRARMYDPADARFMQRDALEGSPTSSQSQDRYTYVENNPATRRDPTGLKSVTLGGNGLCSPSLPHPSLSSRPVFGALQDSNCFDLNLGFGPSVRVCLPQSWARPFGDPPHERCTASCEAACDDARISCEQDWFSQGNEVKGNNSGCWDGYHSCTRTGGCFKNPGWRGGDWDEVWLGRRQACTPSGQ